MVNIVIPMAGEGRRFQEAGFQSPKPLINILGEPMVSRVVRNLRWIARFSDKQRLIMVGRIPMDPVLPLLREGDTYLRLNEMPTQGAVDTILKAVPVIDGEGSLLIGNCDQLLFTTPRYTPGTDGCVITFPSQDPAYSYVKVNQRGFITDIVEKRVISDRAVVGIFYIRHAFTFIESAKRVMKGGTSYNGEFYVSAVIEDMVKQGYFIDTYHVREPYHEQDVHMLGTPEHVTDFATAVNNGDIRLP